MRNFRQVTELGLINDHPRWITDNIVYETIVGSFAYGVSSDTSDADIYGVCIPPKDEVFPYRSRVFLFDKIPETFEQYIKHGTFCSDEARKYDFTIFSIVKAFKLWSESNPNSLEMLYTSNECIITQTAMFKNIRDNANVFLSKKCYNTFINYLYSQIHKAKIKNPQGERKNLVESHGFDTKYVANAVRLCYLCETILTDCTIDLRAFSEHVKSIRKGNESLDSVMKFLDEKEKVLIKLKESSKLPDNVDRDRIRSLLLSSLESHYGSIDKLINKDNVYQQAITDINKILNKYKL